MEMQTYVGKPEIKQLSDAQCGCEGKNLHAEGGGLAESRPCKDRVDCENCSYALSWLGV